MNRLFSGTRFVVALVAISLHGGPTRGAEPTLDDAFQHPSEVARPLTWWHWVSGNVSADGITADLTAMKAIGLGGAQLFTVDQSAVRGPVRFMSPEWRRLVHQALVDADHLGLEMSMEGCDGWCESGGPWVQPAEAMQTVVWTQTTVTGGATVPLKLAQATAVRGYYDDIATLAFPTLRGEEQAPASMTASVLGGDGAPPPAPVPAIITKPAKSPLQIDLAYDKPITCMSLTLDGDPGLVDASGTLSASVDGVAFTRVCTVAPGGLSRFPATIGTHFRIRFDKLSSTRVRIAAAVLGGARLDKPRVRSGMRVALDVPFMTVDGLTPQDVIDPATIIDLTGRTEWNAPPGRWTVLRIGHTCTGATTHPSTTPGLEVDKLSRAAVQSHLDHMYGPVFADSPQQVGKTLKYILLDSWEAGCANWTPLMRDDFGKRRGYDLLTWLPTFTGRIVRDVEATERFQWDFRRTVADLLADNHYGTTQQFAHAHGMGLYAEAPGIYAPTVADNLQCKGRTDVPMGEFWVNLSADKNIDDPKEASSAAHIYGRPVVACEAFTSRPWTAAWTNDPYGLKALGDQEFCLGVNQFVFHRYAHQPWADRKPGMSMGPWGINFERTNTWWEPGSAWIDYITRCQSLLQGGRFVADVLYFYGEGATAAFSRARLKPSPPTGYDYDACDAEVLLGQSSVDADGAIQLASGMRYHVLVLPDSDRLTLPLLQKVQQLVQQGATVYGPKPTASPSLTAQPGADATIRQIAADVWGDCDGTHVTAHAYGKGRILWGEPLDASAIRAVPDFQASQPEVGYIHRVVDDADVYFVSNGQHVARTINCTFRVDGKLPELWHPDTGRTETVALFQDNGGRTTVPIQFDPIGSTFVVFRRPAAGAGAAKLATFNGRPLFVGAGQDPADVPTFTHDGISMTVWQSGTYGIAATEHAATEERTVTLPPPLELKGPWRLTFPPKLGAPTSATFDHLMSWTDSTDDGVKYFSGTATYSTGLTIPPEFLASGRHAWLDLGTVKNLASVSVNGKSLGVLWKEPFRVDLTSLAKPGTNQLEIRVTNLWPNRLIGDAKLPESQRITWTSVSQYTKDSRPLQSGLIGPARIVAAEAISVRQH